MTAPVRLAAGLLFVLSLAPLSAPTDDPPPPRVEAAVRAAVGRGQARVIVELRVPGGVRPEGELADPAAVAAQRHAIASAQASVRARLLGARFTVIRQYRTVPFQALAIGPEALVALEGMRDLVVGVREDRALAPQRRDHPMGSQREASP